MPLPSRPPTDDGTTVPAGALDASVPPSHARGG